jgi:hypothetical protein
VPSPRRPAPWTADQVLESVAQAGEDATTVAAIVLDWAKRHPHIQITGGRGLSYPSVIMSGDSGHSTARFRGVLALYGSPHNGPPMLEVRVNQMCTTPPYLRNEIRARLTAGLHALGIPRLDAEEMLADKRPNIPLEQLTSGRAEQLLDLIDGWLRDIRAYTAEPETANGVTSS